MLPTAGQTDGLVGLQIFVDTHGCYRLKPISFYINDEKIFKQGFFYLMRFVVTCRKLSGARITCKACKMEDLKQGLIDLFNN